MMRLSLPSKLPSATSSGNGYADYELLAGTLNETFVPNIKAKLGFTLFPYENLSARQKEMMLYL
jgi:hypothetical protein